MRPSATLFVAATTVATACVPAGVPGESVILRTDSAGVEIVINTIAWDAAPSFATLDGAAEVRLGSVQGPAEEQFGRVTDVLALPDGGVAVLDGLAGEVRVFDSEGAYRMTLGSKGEGPGQFERPIRLGLSPGDTLAVYDALPRRITRFAPDGSLGRVTTLQEACSRIVAAAFLPDGRLIGQSRWLGPGGALPPMGEAAFRRDSAVITVFTTDGIVEDTADVVPGSEYITRIDRRGSSISVLRRPAAFGRSNVFASHPLGIWSSANDAFELRLLHLGERAPARIVRAPGLERPITDAHVRMIRDRALSEAETPEARQMMETWVALSPRPEVQPAFDRFQVDAGGRLWVRAWSTPDPATRWWVFAADGDLLGSVDVPPGMEVMSIDCARLWGVEQDDLDVSYVVRYSLRGTDPC
ncbi:MAG: hypothetical protein MJB57_13265 [Gemmatimonadetes bacterium]|nr:hypothetical protein [Gemmatimonadota bacterium]